MGEAPSVDRHGASQRAIRHHYDLGNTFYELWLDSTLTYSCALWSDSYETLESAQLRKLDYHAEMARAAGASRVLDIGCGWGSLLRRLSGVHGIKEAVGLTLSPAQARYIERHAQPGVQVRVESWADHDSDARYDAVICIGAMEHFCRPGIGPRAKAAQYRRFFERVHAWLGADGRLSLQTIAKGDAPLDRRSMAELLYIVREIFPESELPRLQEILSAAQGLFEPELVRSDRQHYTRTCEEWRSRLGQRRERALAVAGEAAVARYERYLDAVIRQFECGHADLLRISFRRL